MSGFPTSNIPGRITASAEMLEAAVADLLRRIPETWQTHKPDDLSETQAQALFLLTAAGMVERRERLRLRFAGHPVVAEATATFTGEYGGIEALRPLVANLWTDWQDAFRAWQKGDAANVSPFHCERLEPSEWRLTDQGVIARNDLDAPQGADTPPPRQVVFDFVLKRGFFDGKPLLMPDGRIRQQLPVRGKGALEKMERVKVDARGAGPAGVNIVNWADGGKVFADAFAGLFAAMEAKTATPAAPTPQGPADQHAEWLAKAMLLVRDHPDWSDAEIARRVGKNAGTLSRSNEYKMAAKLARGSKTDRPKGYVTVDPDSEVVEVEGVAPPAAPVDDRSDRGKPIPGSRYFREYCAECNEPMKVTADKVGTKPVCNHCAE